MKKVLICFFVSSLFLTVLQAQNLTVIGVGRLGLSLALIMERSGYNVMGVDVAQEYVGHLNRKTLNSPEPFINEYLRESKHFSATISLDEGLDFADICFVVVQTPNSPYEAYDHTILSKLLTQINKRKIKNKHIVICCTVFPGYIKNIASCLLKDCENVTISYNPEFVAQGEIIRGYETADLVLIGEGSQEIGDSLEAILKALGHDSRIGHKCLKPGYGFGGPCFPRDNRALGAYADKVEVEPFLPIATDKSNKAHARYMAEAFAKKRSVKHVFEDVNYKSKCDVVFLEESQKLAVALLLAQQGKNVVIRDCQHVIESVREKFGNLFEYEILENISSFYEKP